MKLTKKLTALGLAVAMVASIGATSVFASNEIEIAEARPGFEIDVTYYNTLEYDGEQPLTRVPVMLNSGVSRYINHSTSQYYAKGATTVVESTTGEHLSHTTTVRLETTSFWGNTTVLVSKSETGVGEVWAETSTTPTKGDPKVYWKI